jgi:hypothetical protein
LELDDVLVVSSISDLTIQTLADRLQRSTTDEQHIYRESELDELWRLLDIAASGDGLEGIRRKAWLATMRDAVHRAHDLVGMEGRPQEAAAVLRDSLR